MLILLIKINGIEYVVLQLKASYQVIAINRHMKV